MAAVAYLSFLATVPVKRRYKRYVDAVVRVVTVEREIIGWRKQASKLSELERGELRASHGDGTHDSQDSCREPSSSSNRSWPLTAWLTPLTIAP